MFSSSAHVYDALDAFGKDDTAESAAGSTSCEPAARRHDVARRGPRDWRPPRAPPSTRRGRRRRPRPGDARARPRATPRGPPVRSRLPRAGAGALFDVVTCLFGSIGYADGPEGLRAAVASITAHLAPGGVMIVDGRLRAAAWRDGVVPVVVAEDGSRRVGRSHLEGRRADQRCTTWWPASRVSSTSSTATTSPSAPPRRTSRPCAPGPERRGRARPHGRPRPLRRRRPPATGPRPG